jgi:hypothetical protein
MIMPGRSWVAGIDIAGIVLLADLRPTSSEAERAYSSEPNGRRDKVALWPNFQILYDLDEFGNSELQQNSRTRFRTAKMSFAEFNQNSFNEVIHARRQI